MQNKMPNSTNEQSSRDIRLQTVRPTFFRPARKVATQEMVEALQKEGGTYGLSAIACLVGRFVFAGIVIVTLNGCLPQNTYMDDQANICRHKGGQPMQTYAVYANGLVMGCHYPSEDE